MEPDEFSKIVELIRPLLYGDVDSRQTLQDHGINLTRSDLYSEIPTVKEILGAKKGPRLTNIFPPNHILLNFLDQISIYEREFNPPKASKAGKGYFWENSFFSYSDALAYYCIIRHTKPNQILEIGGSYSSLIAAQALKKNGKGVLKVINPNPEDFHYQLPGIHLIDQPLQELDVDSLALSISPGDIVFIDSSHSLKYGSEVLNIYLDFIHLIEHFCYIQVHDVYLPDPFPRELMLNHQLFWGEQYLLYAYLLENSRIEVLYGSHYHSTRNPEALTRFMAKKYKPGGASFWFKQNSK